MLSRNNSGSLVYQKGNQKLVKELEIVVNNNKKKYPILQAAKAPKDMQRLKQCLQALGSFVIYLKVNWLKLIFRDWSTEIWSIMLGVYV